MRMTSDNEILLKLYRSGREAYIAKSRVNDLFVGRLSNPDRYLHHIYHPASSTDIEEFEKRYSRRLSSSHARLLTVANGATLFDCTLYIFGIGRGNITRSTSDDDQAAISLDAEIEKQIALQTPQWRAGWCPIGSLVALARYRLEGRETGEVQLRAEDGAIKSWRNLDDALDEIIATYQGNFDATGVRDGNYEELEHSLRSLVVKKH